MSYKKLIKDSYKNGTLDTIYHVKNFNYQDLKSCYQEGDTKFQNQLEKVVTYSGNNLCKIAAHYDDFPFFKTLFSKEPLSDLLVTGIPVFEIFDKHEKGVQESANYFMQEFKSGNLHIDPISYAYLCVEVANNKNPFHKLYSHLYQELPNKWEHYSPKDKVIFYTYLNEYIKIAEDSYLDSSKALAKCWNLESDKTILVKEMLSINSQLDNEYFVNRIPGNVSRVYEQSYYEIKNFFEDLIINIELKKPHDIYKQCQEKLESIEVADYPLCSKEDLIWFKKFNYISLILNDLLIEIEMENPKKVSMEVVFRSALADFSTNILPVTAIKSDYLQILEDNPHIIVNKGQVNRLQLNKLIDDMDRVPEFLQEISTYIPMQVSEKLNKDDEDTTAYILVMNKTPIFANFFSHEPHVLTHELTHVMQYLYSNFTNEEFSALPGWQKIKDVLCESNQPTQEEVIDFLMDVVKPKEVEKFRGVAQVHLSNYVKNGTYHFHHIFKQQSNELDMAHVLFQAYRQQHKGTGKFLKSYWEALDKKHDNDNYYGLDIEIHARLNEYVYHGIKEDILDTSFTLGLNYQDKKKKEIIKKLQPLLENLNHEIYKVVVEKIEYMNKVVEIPKSAKMKI